MFSSDSLNEGDNKALSITPMICVGIGGTGRDVLVRIRKILVEEFGSLEQMPIISFVQIDTDQGGHINSYRGQFIDFSPVEEVHIQVSFNQVNEFKENHGRRQKNQYVTNPDDNIFEWFPDQLIRNLSTIEHGAGAIRAVGRFALFKNYTAIKEALNSAYGRIASVNLTPLIDRGIQVGAGLRVFVAGSLCGGTGSGIFLDIGYILRRLFAATVVNFETHGYFVISPELYGNNNVVKANCYAALKELDYYTRKGTVFNAQYPGDLRVEDPRPPYDYTYLISNSTPGSVFVLSSVDPNAKGKVTNMIAQKICLFFISNATAKTAISARDNLRSVDSTEEHDNHPRPNRQRYMTAGLASIYFPQDKINQIAGNKVKLRILDFWRSGLGQAPTSSQLQQAYLGRFGWNTSNLKELLQNQIERIQVRGGTISASIKKWNDEQYSRISAAQSRADLDNLRIELPQKFTLLLNYLRTSETGTQQGDWITAMAEQAPEITKSIKANIDTFLEQILRPDHQFFCLESVINWLQQLKMSLEQACLEYRLDEIQSMEAELSLIINQMQNEVQALQNHWWPFNKVRSIQMALCRAVDQVEALVTKNYQHQVRRQVRLSAEDLIEFINLAITNLLYLRDFINKTISDLQVREKKLEQLNLQEKTGLPIIDSEDIQAVVEAVLPSKQSERRLVFNQVSNEILGNAVTVKTDNQLSFQHLIKPQFAPTQIPKALDQVVDRIISRVTLSLQGSAIQRFMTMGTSEQLIAHLINLKNQSDILLPLNLDDGYFNNASHKRKMLIAYHQPSGDDPHVQAFTRLLRQAGLSSYAEPILPSSEQHQVIFMTEYAGFPLRLINDLTAKNFQHSYESRGESGDFSRLHTNKAVVFTDILPPPPEVVREIQELFFKCLALGIFELRDNMLRYRDESDKLISLKAQEDWSAIIDQFSWVHIKRHYNEQSKTLVDILEQQLKNKIDFLESNPLEWRRYKSKIQELIDKIRSYPPDHINFAMVPIVAGTVIKEMTAVAKKGILEELIEEIDKRINNEPNKPLVALSDSLDRPLLEDLDVEGK